MPNEMAYNCAERVRKGKITQLKRDRKTQPRTRANLPFPPPPVVMVATAAKRAEIVRRAALAEKAEQYDGQTWFLRVF